MNTSYKKAVFQARRGMLELDILLKRYLENNFSTLSDDLIKQFYSFMDLNDPDLLDLLVNENNQHPNYREFKNIVNHIIERK